MYFFIGVTPPLSTPLPPEPLSLIAPLLYPSGSFSGKEDCAVIEIHQKKWKGYV